MIHVSYQEGGIAVLTIDQPERAVNVFGWDFADQLEAAISRVAEDPAVTGVVLTSGKAGFMAGADLAMLQAFARPDVTPAKARDLIARLSAPMRRIELLGKPVVGASPGTALGGGFELLLACHYRVVSDAGDARYGLPEATLGLLPGAGGTQRLPRLVGLPKALPLLLEGRGLNVGEAQALGLVNEVVPQTDLLPAAFRSLREGRVPSKAPWDQKGFRIPGGDTTVHGDLFLATNARLQAASRGNLEAPKAIASCVYEGSRLPMDAALDVERQYFATLVTGPTAQALIRTLFFARQAADKLARRPAGVPKSRVSRLGVVGAGLMGRGIAEVAALSGIDVQVMDRDLAASTASVSAVVAAIDAAVEKKRLSEAAAATAKARITPVADWHSLADCDLVIEAVFEDARLKQEVLRQLDDVMAPGVVIASNTSTMRIGGLTQALKHPERFIGLHFFSPVPRMALVETVVTSATDDTTLARGLDFVRQLRKTPIVVNDAHGFYTSRCVEAYVRESLRLVAEGVEPARIENAALAIGMPVGPLAMADEAGLDVLWNIKESARLACGSTYVPDESDRLFDEMKRRGRLGRKSGGGFYEYGGTGKRLWSGIADLRADERPGMDDAEVRQRLLFIQCLTAASAFEQGVVEDAAEADLGAVLGWAFPSHLGGPFAAIERNGIEHFCLQAGQLAQRHGTRFAPPALLQRMASEGRRFHEAETT
ncbi:MAG: enoyl-CoA hydratase/isomerase family protein [Hydrogenophaga sp.]|uniref:3-hydroxyacyl-CoA dehydrogenase NAD-binding domain-containing protein n=1 Tax=Hydrogenophaga sp. TaxID=1904254 RepID=UPI002631BBB0|nr:3-hydroxyacyl-CoA dehydrogenase NAD-binding domain-containing protein [Hydrogenophaga sp.]MCW5668705.1 enoyl-CoA hydratase/isomerase family protein [Hydrogenophaga sp.]